MDNVNRHRLRNQSIGQLERGIGSDRSGQAICPVSECNLSIDVILLSSDGVRFGFHTKNILTFAGAFPDCATDSNVMSLPESSDAVSLLLQYMHHQRQPDSSKFNFEILSQLADAVEKYKVFSAMEVCNVHMTEALAAQSPAVFRYAAKHGYTELGDLAAPRTISRPFDEMVDCFQDEPDILFAWIQYREWWLKILLYVFTSPPCYRRGICKDSWCPKLYHDVLSAIAGDIGSMQDIGSITEVHAPQLLKCFFCSPTAIAWSSALSGKVAAVPKFSGVLSSQWDDASTFSFPMKVLSNLVSSVMGYITPVRPLTESSAHPKCPVQDCRLEIDIILKSSDGIHFGSHVRNLETYSDGFPPSAFSNSNTGTPVLEVVSLPESSDVLSLLLRYMHNQRQPKSNGFRFDVLSRLAEAAEKYMVFSAMEVCKIYMKAAIADHPLSVLRYAAIHGYPELSDSAAPQTISLSLASTKKSLSDKPQIFLAWLRYREYWLTVIRSTLEPSMIPGHGDCNSWLKLHHSLLERIGRNLGEIQNIDKFLEFNLPFCMYCSRALHTAVRQRIAGIPKFSSLL